MDVSNPQDIERIVRAVLQSMNKHPASPTAGSSPVALSAKRAPGVFERLDDAVAHINAGPRPLALYWFGRSDAVRDDVLRRTVSGGVTVNDTLMHIAHDNLPFGGVGDSGWGAYHGEQGFLRFCHQKAVLVQSRWAMGSLFYPPYGARFDKIMGLLRRWL